MYLGSAPERILKTHSSDKVAHLFADPRSATAPTRSGEAHSVPTHNSFGPDDGYDIKDARKATIEPNEQGAVGPAQIPSTWSGWPELSVAHLATHLCRPLALFAGRDDPLSHPDELLRLEEGLKARQVPCWLSLYGGEGRTWRHKETYADYYSRVAGFFDRFLRFRAGG